MNNIYEVERSDYVSFVDEIIPSAKTMKVEKSEDKYTWYKIYSKKTGKMLCAREINSEDEEHYFIFEMPEDDERRAPRPRLRLNLETREEVQAFFTILSKLSKKSE